MRTIFSNLKRKLSGDSQIFEGNPAELKKTYPPDFSAEEIELIKEVESYSMTGQERMIGLLRAIDYLEANGIQGDFIECGVWKGGSMMLAAKKLIRLSNFSRRLFLFDTFEGMSEPSSLDKSFSDVDAVSLLASQNRESTDADNIWCYSTLEEVQNNLSSTNYPNEKICFVKGKVEDTLPHKDIDKIALLRLDTDWYESTKHELECLYDKLEKGGILIIDDYGHWKGAKLAVDEFFRKRGIKIFLGRLDYTGRIAVKID